MKGPVTGPQRDKDAQFIAVLATCTGGRQLDYTPSALDMLPAVAAVCKGRVPVLMDGGIRRGTDVFKVGVHASSDWGSSAACEGLAPDHAG